MKRGYQPQTEFCIDDTSNLRSNVSKICGRRWSHIFNICTMGFKHTKILFMFCAFKIILQCLFQQMPQQLDTKIYTIIQDASYMLWPFSPIFREVLKKKAGGWVLLCHGCPIVEIKKKMLNCIRLLKSKVKFTYIIKFIIGMSTNIYHRKSLSFSGIFPCASCGCSCPYI